ncbi:hypothetical protein [Planktothrix agardhii]|jgi:hypothetical protein|nr:hypothetical protein [Planktothrix agardhii]
MIAQFYHNPRAIAFSNRKEAIALNYYGWLRICVNNSGEIRNPALLIS